VSFQLRELKGFLEEPMETFGIQLIYETKAKII